MDVLIQAVGAVLIAFGVALIYLPAGIIVGGVMLLVFGMLLEGRSGRHLTSVHEEEQRGAA